LGLDLAIYLPEPDVVPEEVKNVVELLGDIDRLVVGFELVLPYLRHLKDVVSRER
jgi:hypothetical protein